MRELLEQAEASGVLKDHPVGQQLLEMSRGKARANCIQKVCPNGCETQEDWINAFYKVFRKDPECALMLYEEKGENLKGYVLYPRHHRCYNWWDVDIVLEQESRYYGTDFSQEYREFSAMLSRRKGPTTPVSLTDTKVPERLNLVWVTSASRTVEKNEELFDKHNKYLIDNVNATDGWVHTVWTNDVDVIPDSVKSMLDGKHILLKSIDELDITWETDIELKNYAKNIVNESNYVYSSQIIRYLVEYYEGGIYVDGDYKITNVENLKFYMANYDNVFGDFMYSNGFSTITNCFIGCAPFTEAMKYRLEIAHRNLFTAEVETLPDYINYPCHFPAELGHKLDNNPALLGFLMLKDTDNTFFIPPCALQRQSSSPCNVGVIGFHAEHVSWYEPELTLSFNY